MRKLFLRMCMPLLGVIFVLVLSLGLIPVSETLWAKVLFVSGSVHTLPSKPHPKGTSIEAEKTAQGYAIGIEEGVEYGVEGEVCVANVGDRPTQELKIVDYVQIKLAGKGKFFDLEGATVSILPEMELDPGETACFPYTITFNQVEEAKAYRNVAHVTITNQAGHMGEPFGPEVKADFDLPQEPVPEPIKPVRPILECVVDHGNGTYSAIFGYLNENDTPVEIPIGADNKFTPSPEDRGQPTTFEPGRTQYDVGVFSVVFDGSNLVWTLQGRTSTASSGAKQCPLEPPEGAMPPPPTEEPDPLEVVTPAADDPQDP